MISTYETISSCTSTLMFRKGHMGDRMSFCRIHLWEQILHSCKWKSFEREVLTWKTTPSSNIQFQHLQPRPGVLISYDFRSPLVFWRAYWTTPCMSSTLFNSLWRPFSSRKTMCFSSTIMSVHDTCAAKHVLEGFAQIPWLAQVSDLSLIEHIWDKMGR